MRLVEQVHLVLKERIQQGDTAIDATVGNGHDTLFLAELVGERGHVFGFDIQESAIENTRQKTSKANLNHRVSLFQRGHQDMYIAVPSQYQGNIAAIVFNLGYLPGGDKSVITQSTNTIAALNHSLKLLKLTGLLSIVIYPGHPGGDLEAQAIGTWVQNLNPGHYKISSSNNSVGLAPKTTSPYWLLIEKIT